MTIRPVLFSPSRRLALAAMTAAILLPWGGVRAAPGEDRNPPAAEIVVGSGRPLPAAATVGRVLAAGPPAGVLVYVLAPDKLAGWPYEISPEARALLPAPYSTLPVVGRLAGRGGTIGGETVARLRPDLIVDTGSTDPAYVSLANRIPEQTGLPYVLIGGRIGDTPATLRAASDLLGVPGRGEELSSFARKILSRVSDRIARRPEIRRPRVYYARSADGLETGLRGSLNAEAIDFLGASNVAEGEGQNGIGRVSLEQVMRWDPDVIIAMSPAFIEEIGRNPMWQALRAVRDHHVYLAPSLPFGWIDSPPGVNRVIGVPWLAQKLYPALFPESIRDDVRDFLRLFYGCVLDDRTLDRLVAGR
ncbi:MAG: iron ABC transporter substrate-binding protein [Telmatospirillum sp.]|nr:iron ABC transporter substrate-binding protein [Telmatospirillum sp.]